MFGVHRTVFGCCKEFLQESGGRGDWKIRTKFWKGLNSSLRGLNFYSYQVPIPTVPGELSVLGGLIQEFYIR